jgi:ribose transport system ATP-binding protein
MSAPAPASVPLLAFDRITQRFPGVVALDTVSFSVESGELHAICGENGAGKSTLMKILSGVYTEPEGTLLVRGQPVRFRGTSDAERAGIAIIHQELNLVDELSIAANMFLGRERSRWGFLDERGMRSAAQEKLRELDCDLDPRTLVKTLRIGDQQLVEIAKALLLDADILIMDEPTSALTESEVARLYRVIAELRRRGKTILYISHKMDEVFTLADRITVLRDGKQIRTLVRAETSPAEITSLMVGREIDTATRQTSHHPGDVVLEVDRLGLPWPGHARAWRLREISFQLRAGEVVGLAGLMGAGRTELLECLFGANEIPWKGQVRLDGRPVRFTHPAEAVDAGIALVTEDRKRLGLFTRLDVGENISLCHLASLRSGWRLIGWRDERQIARETVSRLGVKTAGVEAAITGLSGGNQQKCIIGRWLLTRPKVLLLDDPTRGVDVGAKAELYALIDDLCRQGLAVIVTSSELPELLTLCDRILVLREGELSAEFTRETASEHAILQAAV